LIHDAKRSIKVSKINNFFDDIEELDEDNMQTSRKQN